MAASVYGTHTLCKERMLKCRIIRISIQLLLPEKSTYNWRALSIRRLQVRVFESVGVTTIKRLDQGHLHSQLLIGTSTILNKPLENQLGN
jgi:hypothetical protein